MATTFLTQEGFQTLQDELDYLRNEKRDEIAKRLHEAMEGGELIENAEYEAAKNEQAFVEGRIKELEIILATARVVDDSKKEAGVIHIGSRVTIRDENGQKEEYKIVGAAEANPKKGKISNESPLGKALLNRTKGEEVEVEAPDGSFKIKIMKVE